MATVAVAHTNLMAKGGGEGVCMNVLEALEDDHDVTLLTLFPPDLAALNEYFRTDVGDVEVRWPPGVAEFLDAIEMPLYNLRNALLNRFVERRASEYDLVVGTDNELSVSGPLVQYVHTPRFARNVVSPRVGQDGFVDHLYDRLSYRLGGFDAAEIRDSAIAANSNWMAGVVQDAYDVRPRVVHPPVDTRGFVDEPWDERENGFVTVGRLARYKNVERNIEILDGVRERGHDVHLHVVGPAYDREYAREIAALAADRDYVHLEGECSREELVRIVSRHRYGLHGKRHEHFGMVVAEFVAGGAIPFVPNDGGQREIVGERSELRYDTTEGAVEKIDRVLSNPDLQREARASTAEVERRFGRARFRREMRELVDEALA
ncbi:glycosyltransferase family 4 protein [Haladaptatus salinisoli]|uniref:glycosyltransferase family 4 protein n=1 Tax=Haladaptatus salinisoli TaxID=2884876 RepID=UPI001D09AAB4|nr:glycosyltransferase family 4 protein [Haladaptatus salinisoli]